MSRTPPLPTRGRICQRRGQVTPVVASLSDVAAYVLEHQVTPSSMARVLVCAQGEYPRATAVQVNFFFASTRSISFSFRRHQRRPPCCSSPKPVRKHKYRFISTFIIKRSLYFVAFRTKQRYKMQMAYFHVHLPEHKITILIYTMIPKRSLYSRSCSYRRLLLKPFTCHYDHKYKYRFSFILVYKRFLYLRI